MGKEKLESKNRKRFISFLFLLSFSFIFLSFNIMSSDILSSENEPSFEHYSLNIQPTDTIQKEVKYNITEYNNETGENETITKTRQEDIDIIKASDSDYEINDDKVEFNIDIKLTELGNILSGAPGQMNYSEVKDNLNKKNYTFDGGNFTTENVENLRGELENLSFSVLKGEEIEQERNIPTGLAVSNKDSHSLKVVMKKDFDYEYGDGIYKYLSFKLGSHSTNVDLTDSLVSYYKLDEPSEDEISGDVIDSHGNNTGTYNGTTLGETGILNNAFYFGSEGDDSYVDLPNTIIPSTFSLSFWWYAGGVGSGTESYLFAERYNHKLIIREDDVSGKLGYYYGDSQGDFSDVSNGNWYHIVVTYDETSNELEGYINGNNEFSTSATPDVEGDGVGLGANYNGGLSTSGKIDEVGIWNKALNSTEVSELYNNGDALSYDDFDVSGNVTEPNIETLQTENINKNSAEFKGNLTSMGDYDNVDVYFKYKKTEQ